MLESFNNNINYEHHELKICPSSNNLSTICNSITKIPENVEKIKRNRSEQLFRQFLHTKLKKKKSLVRKQE